MAEVPTTPPVQGDVGSSVAQASQPTTDPLAGLGDVTQPKPSTLPDEQIDRTARMAAISNAPISQVLQNYQGMVEANRQIIQQSGDLSLRLEAAAQQQNSDVTGLARLATAAGTVDPTGELQRGATLAMGAAVNEDIQRRAEYTLEQRALQRLRDTAQSDPTQAAVIYNNMQHPGAEAVLDDINTKRLIIAREVEKAETAVQNQGWLKSAIDTVAGFIDPFTASSMGGNYAGPEVVKDWYDWIMGGTRQRNEASSLWSLSPYDFAKAMPTVIANVQKNSSLLGYTDNTKALSLLTGLQNTQPVWETNLQQGVNAAAVVLPFFKIGKATEIGYALLRSGNRAAAAEALSGATIQGVREGVDAASAASGLSHDNIIDGIRPTVVNDGTPTSSVNVSGNALDAIDRAKLLTQQLTVQGPGRATATEYAAAYDRAQKLWSSWEGRPIKDWRVDDVELPDGSSIKRASYFVGKTKGDGFANYNQAQNWARANGNSAFNIVQDDSGQYFINIQRDIQEVGNGTYAIQLAPGLQRTGIAGRFTLGARQIEDPLLASYSRVSGNTNAKMQKFFVDNYSDALRNIPGAEKDTLRAVLAWGEHQGVWMTDDELGGLYQSRFNRLPTDAERMGYRAMQDINDVEYGMRNTVEYKSRVIKGYETASFEHPLIPGNVDRENALISRNPTSPPLGRIYDTTTDTHLPTVSSDELKAMGNDGKVLVTLERERELADGTTIKHFIVDKKGLTAEPLREDQLPYRAGGHRMYADNYFEKQAVYGTQQDTGETFLKNPATYSTGTKAEMVRLAEVHEEARQLYLTGERNPEAYTDILSRAGFEDGKTFLQRMEDGTYQKNTPFKALGDREMPNEYLTTPHSTEFLDKDETGVSGWLRTNGRMYYSSKGAPLLDWKGNLAKTLDPFEVANTALMNVANLASWSDYKISAVSRWVDTFKPFINMDALPKGASDFTIFSDAKIASNVDKMELGAGDKIKQAMEAQRDIIRRNIGWQSDWDAQVKAYSQRIANYVMGDDPESFRHAIGEIAVNWWDSMKPLAAMRGLAFDLKMGLFNVAHFPMRIQTMLATMALSGPEQAGYALSNFIPMRLYLMKSGTENMLDAFVKNGVDKMAGFDTPAEYKMMMREGKNSGFFDIGNTHQMINAYGPDAAAGNWRNAWDKFTKAGRFALTEGEIWNSAIAWQTAWQEVAPEFAGQLGTRDMLNQVALKASDYRMSMDTQSMAAWQKGPMSIPTQFFSYQARVMEALLGSQFTTAQKMRLFASQTFFYGSAGTPLGYLVSQKLKGATGGASPDPSKKALDTFWGAMDRGAFDELVYHTTGADVMFGQRYGTGTFMVDLVQEILGTSAYGEKSWLDTMGGATYSIFKDTGKVGFQTLKAVIDYATAESGAQDFPLVKDDIIRLLNNSSAFSYTLKGIMAHRYRIMMTNGGSVTANDLPSSDAVFIGMGVQPGETDQVAAMQQYLQNRKKTVQEATKIIENLRMQYFNEPDRRSEILSEINVTVRLLPDDIRFSALRSLPRQLSPDARDTLGKQLARDRALAEEVKQYGPADQ